MTLRFAVLFGSMRSDRAGIRAARFIVEQLRRRGHEPTLVDALECQLPLLDRMYKEYPKGEAPAVMERLATLYRAVDGFVIVAGEYNHGIQPGLKNLLDHFLEEYFWRPSAIVCYSAGVYGGVRAAMQLRMTLAELGMPSIPSLFPIGRIGQALAEDGTAQDQALERRVGRFVDELAWYAAALKAARAGGTPY
jgi:NAD(P)H-dependent FMN reductase